MQVNQDKHLGTGEYRPEKYWSARAKKSNGALLDAVCVFDAPESENRSADLIQRRLMAEAIKNAGIVSGSVMEFGCGGGRWCEFFQRQGYKWCGIDISEDMLTMASKKHPQVDLRKTDGQIIPHPDASFDLLYSVTVVHHNPHESQERIFDEMLRVLKPGGTLILYEDLGEMGQFNMFPRRLEGWISVIKARGWGLQWQRTARYWVIRDIVCKMLRKPPTSFDRSSLLRRMLGQLDLWSGMLFQRIVPEHKRTTAVMVFRKLINEN